ncbi:MAG: type II toxin-antitoxin system Phd/YefM family antitoxin [Oscillospiraceae bacterium]|nr:type II toxin-antitoxin system Phd/YefM family antitoxin [Oscillospiraceae bacterium]
MYVTATEFKANFGRYLRLAEEEEIIVTRRGKPDIPVGQKQMTRAEMVRAMRGVIPLNEETKDISVESIRAERRKRYEYSD